ncbi:MAG TPA: hypothetical protein VGO09_04635 [Flavisolibacter sp.]|jgi:hypothetical protein|nr:hypothetical protein [Flavisolibacter sp.]
MNDTPNSKKITLAFPAIKILWEFRKAIGANVAEISFQKKTLTCHCTEENIDLAIVTYKAMVVGSQNTILAG